MAPFLRRAGPAARERSAARRVRSAKKLQRLLDDPVSHSRRPEPVGAAHPQRRNGG